MSTPVPTTPKAPRNSRRNQKRTPSAKHATADPSHQPNKANTPATTRDMNTASDSANHASESAAKSKKGRSVKKNKENVNHSPAPAQQASHGHRHTSSQPSIVSPSFRDSPHYAGPTFHASPAPSALPMPSFFSKSVPETDYPTPDDLPDDPPDSEPGDTTPTKAKNILSPQQEAGTASPLDFLFKAARQARTVNPLSELEDSGPSKASTPPPKKSMYSQYDGPSNSGMFPLELEGSDARSSPIGPSFATSYRDRMNALRASSPGKQPDTTITQESHETIKGDALTNLLLNPASQRAASASPRLTDPSNPSVNSFRLSGDYSMHNQPVRYASGPSSPVPFAHSGKPPGSRKDFGPESSVPHQYLASLCGGHPQRAPSSSLRTMVSPTSPITPPRRQPDKFIQLASAPPAHSNHHGSTEGLVSPTPNRTTPPFSATPPPRNGTPSRLDAMETRRMEDDLRRILKLKVGDGRSPNSMEQTIA
ncbi:hypothetical protein FQN49_002411 [Arthroderma sp. PD_2]|nr:hypothetical protein FQN49_002411 [Arthroderma sp. PD_2]